MENSKGRRSATGSNADIASTISDFEEVRLEDMEHSGSGEEVTWSGELPALVTGFVHGYLWCSSWDAPILDNERTYKANPKALTILCS